MVARNWHPSIVPSPQDHYRFSEGSREARMRIFATELEPVPCPKNRRKGTGRRTWPGHCYERAGRYQLEQRDVTLVHALIRIGIFHAWCELPEGLVYDGVDNAFYDATQYRAHVGVHAEKRYTVKEAAHRMIAANMWDCWDARELRDQANIKTN